MEPQRIVISYFGDPVTDTAKIVNAIDSNLVGGNKMVQISTMTAKEAEECLTSMLAVFKATKTQPMAKDSTNPLDKAILYIGMRFADMLVGPDKNSLGFTIAITSAIALAKQTNSDKELLTAAEIISSEDVNVRKALCRKYGIDATVVNIIKTAYTSDPHTYGYVFG